MKFMSKALAKGTIATVAAGAMAMASSPANAQWRDRHDDDIDVGDVIAGAVIIGGIAAAISAIDNDNDRYRDGRYYRGDYRDGRYYRDYRGGARGAIEQCVRAAERDASRYSWGGHAKVTDIRDIDSKRDGYNVKGRIAVNTNNRDWRRGWGNDYRGWNDRYRGYDAGKFTCKVRYGRISDLDFSGIRGL